MSTEPANPIEIRMARLEGLYEQINLRLSSLEGQIAEIRGDLRGLRTDIDTKFSTLDGKIDGLRAYTDSQFGTSRRETAAQFDKLDKKIDARFNLIALLGALLIVLQVLNTLEVI